MRNFKLELPKRLFKNPGTDTVNLEAIITEIATSIADAGDTNGIYTGSGSLTVNTTVTGASKSLLFTGLTTFGVSGSGHNTTTTTGTGDILHTAASDFYVNAGGEAITTSVGTNRLESTTSDITLTGATGVTLDSGSTITLTADTDFSLTFGDDNGASSGLITDSSTTPAGLEYTADYSATFSNESLVTKRWVTANFIPKTTSGSGAPGTAPSAVGLMYIDTTAEKVYISTGTTTTSNWKILN